MNFISVSPHPSSTARSTTAYDLSRNKSEGAILHKKSQEESGPDEDGEKPKQEPSSSSPHMPSSYQQVEGNRAYSGILKSVENLYKSSDLGYSSDMCDVGKVPVAGGVHNTNSDTSYVQQKRPVSMVSPSLKPFFPALESSLYDRRQRLIETRARVFGEKVPRAFSSIDLVRGGGERLRPASCAARNKNVNRLSISL